MWTLSIDAGLVAVALMSWLIVAGNGRDAENYRESGSGATKRIESDTSSALKVNEIASERTETNIASDGNDAPRISESHALVSIDVDLLKSSVLYGVLNEIILSLNHSDKCRQNSELLFNGINNRQLWALKGIGNTKICFST